MRAAWICLAASLTLVSGCLKNPAHAPASNAAASNAAVIAPPAPPAVPHSVADVVGGMASTPAAPAAGPPVASGAPVSGVFTGNGTPATLAFLAAYSGEPEQGQPVTILVFSAQDQSGNPKAYYDAAFGQLGDALVVKVLPDGRVFSADLAHSALQSPGGAITVFNGLSITGFSNAGGQISGRLTSNGEQTVQGQKYSIDLTFHTAAP